MDDRKAPAAGGRPRARHSFFSLLSALLGTGAGMLALLLLASGEVTARSPVIVGLLVMAGVGLAGLAAVLAGVIAGARRGRG